MCSIGSRSNHWDHESREHRQEFRVFEFGWYGAECAVIPIAILAAVRHYVERMFEIKFPAVKIWNSDDHVAYAATRKVLFNADGVAFCLCPVHIVLRITEKKIGGEEHFEELAIQCTMMKHGQFEHIRRASIDIWARKYVPECIHMLELLEEKPFHATQSGLPGHVSDNQPIESLQKIVRDCVGREQHTPRTFFYRVLWSLMEHVSLRLRRMTHQQPVFAVASVIGHEGALQLQALQIGLRNYTEWRTVAFRVPGMDVETYILPVFTISEGAGARARTKCAYALKVDAVEHTAAMAYHDSLSNVNVPPAYASTDAIKKALGTYNMIKRVTQDDIITCLPPTIAARMKKQRWRCNCLEFTRRV